MDYRSDFLTKEERQAPPTFLYAMDLGQGDLFCRRDLAGAQPGALV